MKKWLENPELLFLLFAIPFGLILVFLRPPLGGGDEGFHYHRVASIACFQILNRPVAVPSGITAFIQSGIDFFTPGIQPPFSYSINEWHRMASITLQPDIQVTLLPNYLTVHHPFSYIPQVILFRIGLMAGYTPLVILYLARLAGLAASIALSFFAIRRIPSHKYLLCALALLPTMMTYRSCIIADVLTNGLAFLFIASLLYEITAEGIMPLRNMLLLAMLAFVLAQCKSVYMLLLLLAFAVKAERFKSSTAHCSFLAFIILPGMMLSLLWMIEMKQTFFAGMHYETWGGAANPDLQTAFIQHHPFDFLKIIMRTVFFTPLLPVAFLETIGDLGPGKALPMLLSIGLFYLLVAVALTDRAAIPPYGNTLRMMSTAIFSAAFIMTLVLLYIHWTGLEAPFIKGFQGRYLCPLLPLLIPFIHPTGKSSLPLKPAAYVILLAFAGLVGSVWTIAVNYY